MILTEYFKTNFCSSNFNKQYFYNHALYDFILPLLRTTQGKYNIRIDYISDKIGFNVYSSVKKDKTIEFILNNTSKRTIYFFQNVITIDDNGVFNMEPNFIGFVTLDLSIQLDGLLEMLSKNKQLNQSITREVFNKLKIFIIKNK
jgi:hypothetical protein